MNVLLGSNTFYLTNHMEHINKCEDKLRRFLALQLDVYMVTTGL